MVVSKIVQFATNLMNDESKTYCSNYIKNNRVKIKPCNGELSTNSQLFAQRNIYVWYQQRWSKNQILL